MRTEYHSIPQSQIDTIVIEHLADETAGLRARLAEVEDERETYRALACTALAELHQLSVRVGRQRQTIARSSDECRRLRDAALGDEEAA